MRTITYTNKNVKLTIDSEGLSIYNIDEENLAAFFEFNSSEELESIIADLQDIGLCINPISDEIKNKLGNINLN
jgi:hypothetical protein